MFVFERLSRYLITAGGLGTIVAVSLVLVFLVWVVVPLFLPAKSEERPPVAAAGSWAKAAPEAIGSDDHLLVGWAYHADGTVDSFRLDTGEALASRRVFDGPAPTAFSLSARDQEGLFGFADGTLRFAKVGVTGRSVSPDGLPEPIRQLAVGEHATHDGGVVAHAAEGQFRMTALDVKAEEPVAVDPPSRILLVDFSHHGDEARFAAVTEDGRLVLETAREQPNMLTGEITRTYSGGEIRLPQLKTGPPPRYVKISGVGDSTYLIWADGRTVRVDTRDPTAPQVAEVLDVVPEGGGTVTAVAFLIGRTTMVVGDSSGNVRGWFCIKPEDAGTRDGANFTMAHELEPGKGAVTAVATSQRSRLLAAAYADGSARLFQMTTENTVAELGTDAGTPLQCLAMAPKDDGIIGTNGKRVFVWRVNAPHADITLASLFLPVWYEGYTKPETSWQSSSGTDAFEAKLGLWPLVFGTIKATFYSMLFGAPLALLAALFTSEFLSGKTKSRVKPVIETMASLPSVVLGFLAAIVIAHYVEDIVPEILSSFVTLPFALLLGANLWQALPGQGRRGALRAWRIVFLFVMSILGVWLGFEVGPWVQDWLFAGDIKLWLDGQRGTGTGAWMFLLVPMSALIVGVAMALFVNPAVRRISRDWDAGKMARVELGKFVAGFVAVIVLAYLLSSTLNWFGWDPRGTFVSTYVQRNALIVGFVMGFAIIPIIYTISEDALSGVPEHLRAASLASGATQWQTAIRIIIPTALSGIFSALMIGFGRAVGETMIVLMAAGNTPVTKWNVFEGFRTLSANIAVEMPEAVQQSTHYRTLYLAALVLFALTFLVNTVAEAVRLRVRKRAYEL
ncbi:MAG TPA: ABC transporter permease subunit [Planctomycetota bacterium]|nr:ABC transporter permease subunit [Planctomycetota bacterium]